MNNQDIVITSADFGRLRALLAMGTVAPALHDELDRAMEVESSAVGPDVVTLGSEVRVTHVESGKVGNYVLVLPADVGGQHNRISVVTPFGTAILGHREGDTIQWAMPGGVQRLRIDKVLFQPEAARRDPRPAV